MTAIAKPTPSTGASDKKKGRGLRASPWLLRPAIIFLILVTQIPFLLTLYFSTSNWNLLRPARRFVGMQNYGAPFSNPDFLQIMLNTVVLLVSVIVLTLALGTCLALLLNRSFFGRNVLRTLLITPFLIMPTVTAVLWKNVLLNPAFGLFASVSTMVGGPRVDWLAEYPMPAIIAIITWEWTPFMMLILLAGLQSMPQEPLEAAQIDGAGPLGMFRYIILPFLRRYIEIAVLLETLFVLSIFGEIFVTTSGGPGIATTNLAYDIYMEAFQRWNIGRASALGVFAVILANIVVLLFVRVLRNQGQERKAARP
jgi:sorbitol/mannitol transport system permease protein